MIVLTAVLVNILIAAVPSAFVLCLSFVLMRIFSFSPFTSPVYWGLDSPVLFSRNVSHS